MESKQLKYYRLRRDHPDLSPADAMDLASTEDAPDSVSMSDQSTDPTNIDDFQSPFESAKAAALDGTASHDEPAAADDSPSDFADYPGTASAPPMVQATPRDTDPYGGIDAEAGRRMKKARANDSATEFDSGIARAINQGIAAITQTKPVDEMRFAPTAPGVEEGYDKKRSRLHESLREKRLGQSADATDAANWRKAMIPGAPKAAARPGTDAERLAELIRHNKAIEANSAGQLSARDAETKRKTALADAKKKQPSKAVKPGAYDALDPSDREVVRAIVEGRAPAPAPGSKTGGRVMSLVTQIDPSFDSSKYGAYAGVREKLSKSDEVVALNTAYGHVSRAKANIPENFDTQTLNRIKRAWQTGSGSDTLTPFETDVKIAADELAKAYGNNSEAGRSTIEHLLEPGQSKAQLQSRLAEVEELLSSKLGSYQHQFDRVAPKGAASFRVLSEENVEKPAAPRPGAGGRVGLLDEAGNAITLPADQVDDYLKDFPKARRR